MIIGNNNSFNNNNFNANAAKTNMYNNAQREKNNFQTKFNRLKNETNNRNNNPFVKDLYTQQHSDPTSAKDMNSKSLAMLQERLDKGLISFDEFNKKCAQLRNKK